MSASPEELCAELHILFAKIKRYENLHLEDSSGSCMRGSFTDSSCPS